MRTAGVDLAAEPVRTGLAVICWDADRAILTDLAVGADDAAILTAAATADKVGIDCPLGWPDAFVDFVTDVRAGRAVGPGAVPPSRWRRQLALRLTDMAVYDEIKLTPLSVSTDRIGLTAMRAASLLTALETGGVAIDRSGADRVVEVYPAAALHCWRLTHRGYKRRANLATLDTLVDALREAAPWLDLDVHESACRASDDAFDAVVAALAARAAALRLVTRPTAEQLPMARREGWIALPTTGLDALRPTDPRRQ